MLFLYNPDGLRCRVGHLTRSGDLIKLKYSNIHRHLIISNLIEVVLTPDRQTIYFLTHIHVYKFDVNDNFVNTDEMLLPSPIFKLSEVAHLLDTTQIMCYHIVAGRNKVWLSPKVPSFEPTFNINFDQRIIHPVTHVSTIECIASVLSNDAIIIQTPSSYFIVLDGEIVSEHSVECIKVSHDKTAYIANDTLCYFPSSDISEIKKHVKFPSCLSFYGNRWVVCLNKLCDFSGSHIESCPGVPNITDQVMLNERIYTEVNGMFNCEECSTVLDWVAISDSKDNMEYFTNGCQTVILSAPDEDDKTYTFYDALATCKNIVYDKTYEYVITDQIKPECNLYKEMMFSGTNQVTGSIIKTPNPNLDPYMNELLSFRPSEMIEITPTETMFVNENVNRCDLTDIDGLKKAYLGYRNNIIDLLMVKELQQRILCENHNEGEKVIMVISTAKQINWLKVLLKEQGYGCVENPQTCYDVIFGK